MNKHKEQGLSLRLKAKDLVLDFMINHPLCQKNTIGLKQADIFRECGLDWGLKTKATSSNQQYWVIALLRELEDKQLIEQVKDSGPWRLR